MEMLQGRDASMGLRFVGAAGPTKLGDKQRCPVGHSCWVVASFAPMAQPNSATPLLLRSSVVGTLGASALGHRYWRSIVGPPGSGPEPGRRVAQKSAGKASPRAWIRTKIGATGAVLCEEAGSGLLTYRRVT